MQGCIYPVEVQLVKFKLYKRIYVGEFTNIKNKLELGEGKALKFIMNPKVLSALNCV